MQTFLPYPSFIESAHCLDYRRLGKQRVEARQILNALKNGGAWQNHPAVKMWRGYETALIFYGNCMITEWIFRGYNNSMEIIDIGHDEIICPPFVGSKEFHASHRSNLLRKDYDYYSKFGWKEPSDLEYVWPV